MGFAWELPYYQCFLLPLKPNKDKQNRAQNVTVSSNEARPTTAFVLGSRRSSGGGGEERQRRLRGRFGRGSVWSGLVWDKREVRVISRDSEIIIKKIKNKIEFVIGNLMHMFLKSDFYKKKKKSDFLYKNRQQILQRLMADATAFRIDLEDRKVWDRKCQMEGMEKLGDIKNFSFVMYDLVWR